MHNHLHLHCSLDVCAVFLCLTTLPMIIGQLTRRWHAFRCSRSLTPQFDKEPCVSDDEYVRGNRCNACGEIIDWLAHPEHRIGQMSLRPYVSCKTRRGGLCANYYGTCRDLFQYSSERSRGSQKARIDNGWFRAENVADCSFFPASRCPFTLPTATARTRFWCIVGQLKRRSS
jgi:hypothetical protein